MLEEATSAVATSEVGGVTRSTRRSRLQELTRRTLSEMLEHEDLGRTMEAWLEDAATLAQMSTAWLLRHPAAQTGAWRHKKWQSAMSGRDDDAVAAESGPPWLDETDLDALASGVSWAHPPQEDLDCPESVHARWNTSYRLKQVALTSVQAQATASP